MFKLSLYDRNGTELKQGDIVAVSDSKAFKFYAEVKWLEKEECIAPFYTFSFHSFEKVDKIPGHAVKSSEERYNIWFTHSPKVDKKEAVEKAERYLLDWRQCERLIESRCFKIHPI